MSSFAKCRPQARLTVPSYAARFFEAVDSPVSLKCALLLKYGEYAQLVQVTIDPEGYLDPADFYRDYQCVKLLSKYPYLPTGIDTQKVAEQKFVWAEKQCLDTNERFRNHSYEETPRASRILFRMQRKIAEILGDVPEYQDLDFSFGPGANYGVRGDTSVFQKISSDLECTFAMADVLPDFLGEFPGWISLETVPVNLVRGSQLTFVLKDAKTMRPICIEPLLNGLYQKGVGSYLRERLLRWGVNLRDQSVNQTLAAKAEKLRLATVDFTSASDTIAYLLVQDLLPHPWFEFLDVARSPRFEYRGRWYNFQKFSSMGNAYTFELETLIFFAMACAVCEEVGVSYIVGENLHVYGDDVIIPQEAFLLFQEMSSICGFTLNFEKSYASGIFFESCGHDYYKGYNVRPFLVKDKRLTTLSDAFYIANSIRAFIARFLAVGRATCYDTRLDLVERLNNVYDWVVGCIPERARLKGPVGFGDGHLHCEWDEASPNRHQQWCGWSFKTLAARPVKVPVTDCPAGYALYDTRHKAIAPPSFAERALNYSVIEWFDEQVPPPLNKGSGYSLRREVSYQLSHGFCVEWNSCKNLDPSQDREVLDLSKPQLRMKRER